MLWQSQEKRVWFPEYWHTVTPVSTTIIGSSIEKCVASSLHQNNRYSVKGFVFPSDKQAIGSLELIHTCNISVVSGSSYIETQSITQSVNYLRKHINDLKIVTDSRFVPNTSP